MQSTPKISATKLIEYCNARSPRRTAIIEEAIKPKRFLLDTRYDQIERAMMAFISYRGENEAALATLDEVLLLTSPVSPHDEMRLLNAHDAIELARTMDLSVLPSVGEISPMPDRQPRLSIEGVSISVRPTNIISRQLSGQRIKKFGLIKPYLSKIKALNLETASLHGALLHWYAEEMFPQFGHAEPELSLVLDVFQQRVFSAPQRYKQRRKLLLESCREIYDRWGPIRHRLTADEPAERDAGKST